MNDIPEEAIEIIKERAKEITFGSIRIEVLQGKPYVDVIVEKRIRVMRPIAGNLASQFKDLD